MDHVAYGGEPLLLNAPRIERLPPIEELIQADKPAVKEDISPEAPPKADAPDAESETPVYVWYDLHRLLPSKLWAASVELGVNGSAGNSQTVNTRVGVHAKRKSEQHLFDLDFSYINNKSDSIETANQGLLNTRYDWLLPDSPWSLFVNDSLEFDRFRAFDIRWAANLGIGYALIRNDITTLAGRFGSGVSQEVGGPESRYVPEATFGMLFEHQINELQKVTAKVDYFPDWQDFGGYRINSDVGWEILLSKAMNLSLKLGALDRYDSTPNGAKPNDLNYSLLLLWKL